MKQKLTESRSRELDLELDLIVTKEELQKVAMISEWPRRVRELRDDFGWVIYSQNNPLSPEDQQRR